MVIRPTQNADAHSMSRIYVQTWQYTYLGVIPYEYLSTMSVAQHQRAFLNELKSKQVSSFVAEESNRVVGFITGGHERKGDGIYSGEIYTLYVLKNYQRRGIGAKMVSALTARFNQFGIYSMLVWVLKENPYRRFYEKINGIHIQTHHLPVAGEMLDVSAYGWLDTSLIYK
jgi:ribosomal protein S18 acetylase RimI-like enzyme